MPLPRDRTPVFRHRRSSTAASTARRQSHRLLDHRQRRSLGHRRGRCRACSSCRRRVRCAFPDVANWAWHEYGNRVGFWRFVELYERLGIRPTLSINGRVCIDYPRIVEAVTKAGWEMMGHSYEQMPMHAESRSRNDDRPDARHAREAHRPAPDRLAESRIRRNVRYARIIWPAPASSTSPNGRTTMSRRASRRSTVRWSRCRTRSSART